MEKTSVRFTIFTFDYFWADKIKGLFMQETGVSFIN